MGLVLNLEYEGLHQVCFNCGVYGHKKDFCPEKVGDQQMQSQGEQLPSNNLDEPLITPADANPGGEKPEMGVEAQSKVAGGAGDDQTGNGQDSNNCTLNANEGEKQGVFGVWNLVQYKRN